MTSGDKNKLIVVSKSEAEELVSKLKTKYETFPAMGKAADYDSQLF